MSSVTTSIKRLEAQVFRLQLHIKPGAKKSRVMRADPDVIDLQIAAPPRDGEANEEVLAFLTQALGLRGRNVELVGGMKCREKVVLLRLDDTDRRSEEDILQRLQSAIEKS